MKIDGRFRGQWIELGNSLRDSIVNKKGRACLLLQVVSTREKNNFAAVKACLEAPSPVKKIM